MLETLLEKLQNDPENEALHREVIDKLAQDILIKHAEAFKELAK